MMNCRSLRPLQPGGFSLIHHSSFIVHHFMGKFLFYLAAVTVAAYVIMTIDLWQGNRRIRSLKDIAPLEQTVWPRVSVIIAARNEARHIEEALQSVLNQDYPQLE